MKNITIHGYDYFVKSDELEVLDNPMFNPMKIRPQVSILDRQLSFMKELSKQFKIDTIITVGYEDAGYIPINLARLKCSRQVTCIVPCKDNNFINDNNVAKENNSNLKIIKVGPNSENVYFLNNNNTNNNSTHWGEGPIILRLEKSVKDHITLTINTTNPSPEIYYAFIIVCGGIIDCELNDHTRIATFDDIQLYVHKSIISSFYNRFKNYFILAPSPSLEHPINEFYNEVLNYNNLINLCMMVKNAGPDFRQILEQNLPYIDQYTILDTGSTDKTIEIIKDVLKCKQGHLYQEPFINFRDSRNRLLELAGNECVFNIMLDDTYTLNGDLRNFLTLARSDDFADSFSLYINDVAIKYTSNRIVKSNRKLKYKYVVHEVLEPNLNILIPYEIAYIIDHSSLYMIERTYERKHHDLQLLFAELNSHPQDARICYYIAETYLCLCDWENAFKWYTIRSKITENVFQDETYDSLYKIAVIGDIYLHMSWSECHYLYIQCFLNNPYKAEGIAMIGKHYIDQANKNNHCPTTTSKIGLQRLAYMYLKLAFDISQQPMQILSEIGIKFMLYNYHIPKMFIPLCSRFGDHSSGEIVTYQFLQKLTDCTKIIDNQQLFPTDITLNNLHYPINEEESKNYTQWHETFEIMNRNTEYRFNKSTPNNIFYFDLPIICFVVYGGWDMWDGEYLRTHGIGGSETWAIRYAEIMASVLINKYKIIIFCNCKTYKIYNDVIYIPIKKFICFIADYPIFLCIVSRYFQYIPLCIANRVPTYLVMHDLVAFGDQVIEYLDINYESFLKGILCVSKWHQEYMITRFPMLKKLIHFISNGVDVNQFQIYTKRPRSFIYSSFPNRGLDILLKMWPLIIQEFPDATLDIFCNTQIHYLQDNFKELMDNIDIQITQLKNVVNHGWCNSDILYHRMAQSYIFFYPCTFIETSCLTAFEAAASKTLIITNDLAALQDTVGDRGLIIPGDANTEEWQLQALAEIFSVLRGYQDDEVQNYVERNYKWALDHTYSIVVQDFILRFINNIENLSSNKWII